MRSAARQRVEERRRQHSTPEARARRRQAALARRMNMPPEEVVTLREPLPRSLPTPKRRLALWVTIVLTVGTIFGMATFHVLLVQSEFRLEKLTSDAADAQQRYEHLRLEVARLASPERIVATAQQRLGMVVPPEVGYLTAPQPADADTNDAGTGGWSEVKPYLAGRP